MKRFYNQTVCPTTQLKPMVFVACRRNFDFKIACFITHILLNINTIS